MPHRPIWRLRCPVAAPPVLTSLRDGGPDPTSGRFRDEGPFRRAAAEAHDGRQGGSPMSTTKHDVVLEVMVPAREAPAPERIDTGH